ncbi:HNH endonuclease family protein [Pseudomonas sp. HK3]
MSLRNGFACLLFITTSVLSHGQIIKLSNSKICHEPTSPFYDRVKRFEPYSSLSECLKAGGRLPKITAQPKTHSVATNQYSRSAFGHGWADTDKDCQNTRHEVLIEQSSTKATLSSNNCQAAHGRWISMFTGNVITNAKQLDIDHVVPLKWAWEHGADKWPKKRRVEFANDPINLIAVEASLNRAKGAKGPDEWLPPKNQCQYTLRFKRIVKKYDLQMTSKINEMANNCLAK